MYIKQVLIKGFRNFKETSFHLTDGFHTVIGENNIGKSNFLYALRLVLDAGLSYSSRKLNKTDFFGFPNNLHLQDHILISVDFHGANLSAHPCFLPLKTSDDSMRITFVYAHKLRLDKDQKEDELDLATQVDQVEFEWRLACGGNSYLLGDLKNLEKATFHDLEALNIFFLSDFRNIYRDLTGGGKSLLNQYCESRPNSINERDQIHGILKRASSDLDKLGFMPEIESGINRESEKISGENFNVPINVSFSSDMQTDVWKELSINFASQSGMAIPIEYLGLGQKNLLYFSLFLAGLENQRSAVPGALNILLIEEPEAHLHPQVQKVLFKNLQALTQTQVIMTSHSTHIASDTESKNLSAMFINANGNVKTATPFLQSKLETKEVNLLKRYLDATRCELFFSSAVILVEGAAEQFIIPAIAKEVLGFNLTEFNVSVVPIHGRHFDTFLKLFQNGVFEIPAVVITDKDPNDASSATIHANLAKLEVAGRVQSFVGDATLEIDLFPFGINTSYLKSSFMKLGHKQSYDGLTKVSQSDWDQNLISKISHTVRKGRFAQQLAIEIDSHFQVPQYIKDALEFVRKTIAR